MDAEEAKVVRLCAYSVVVFLLLFGAGWGVLGRNIPPYSANLSADTLATVYKSHCTTLRIGFALGALGTTFYIPWTVGLFRIMLRLERGGPVWSYLQLAGGMLTSVVPLMACLVWLTAAFRPEQDPDIIRMLFDMGWLIMDIGFGVTILQYVSLGVVALKDERAEPLFPRWLAWIGIWIGLEFIVELIMPYFRVGPFSWNGLFAYWIPFFGPFIFMTCISYYMARGANLLAAEGHTGSGTDTAVEVTQVT